MRNTVSIALALGFSSMLFFACSGELPDENNVKDTVTPAKLREISVTESNGTTVKVLQSVDNPDIMVEEISTQAPTRASRTSLTSCENWAYSQFGINWVNRFMKANQTGNANVCAAFTSCGSFAYNDVLLAACNNSSVNRLRYYLTLHGTDYEYKYADPSRWIAHHFWDAGYQGTYAIHGRPESTPANYEILTGTSQN
jgi:hypothetical protein